MNGKQFACGPERVERMLGQQLSDDEQAEFEAHLDACDECCLQFEQAVASDGACGTIRESLYSEGSLKEPEDAAVSVDSSAGGENPSFTIETVLQLLAPTDDDRMLGRLCLGSGFQWNFGSGFCERLPWVLFGTTEKG